MSLDNPTDELKFVLDTKRVHRERSKPTFGVSTCNPGETLFLSPVVSLSDNRLRLTLLALGLERLGRDYQHVESH
jgi:hypothetical protein